MNEFLRENGFSVVMRSHHLFAYESFQLRLEMGALNGLDACPFELVSKSQKQRFWLNVLEILQKELILLFRLRLFISALANQCASLKLKTFIYRQLLRKTIFALIII